MTIVRKSLFRFLFFLTIAVLLLDGTCAGQGSDAVVSRLSDPFAEAAFDPDAELLEIWFPNIYDCDGALIQVAGKNYLIDACDASQAKRLVKVLYAAGVDEIDAVFNTHPHHDHIDGLAQVDDAAKVKKLYVCFHEFYNYHMRDVDDMVSQRGIEVGHYEDGEVFTFGAAEMTIFRKSEANWTVNEQSAVMRLQYLDRSILFMADSCDRAWQKLYDTVPHELLKADILKYPHHGVNTIPDYLMDVIDPSVAVVTNTMRVSQTVSQLNNRGIEAAYTGLTALHLVTDGTIWFVEPVDLDEAMLG